MAKPVYQLEVDAVFTELETAAGGLAAAEAAERLERYGPNELAFRKTPAWVRFLRQFEDPMVLILLATGLFTGTLTAFGSEMLPDTIVIFGVVFLNAILGFVQEGKAEGALDALRSMLVQECMVVRDGVEQSIAARDLVPGDVVLLEAGADTEATNAWGRNVAFVRCQAHVRSPRRGSHPELRADSPVGARRSPHGKATRTSWSC